MGLCCSNDALVERLRMAGDVGGQEDDLDVGQVDDLQLELLLDLMVGDGMCRSVVCDKRNLASSPA